MMLFHNFSEKGGWFIHFGFATLDGAQPQEIVLGI